tara:strand:- start:1337 stop:2284 length:948 start_codon:yes stop_codon:yes gene_type:complete
LIRVENLSKKYGSFEAIKSINFELNDGEIVGFLGANGAGKSTTLKVMTGYLSPSRGNVYLNNLNIIDHSLEIQKQIGYLPELNPLYGEMKVFDLLEFVAQIRQITGKNFKKSLSRVIDQCGLNGVIHKSVDECSKGYKQRLGLACAMIHDPKILILDEPVTGLDPNQIVEIRSLIKELGREKLVLMSSHILQEIQATVNRIIIINKGKIVADGSNEELMKGFANNTELILKAKNVTTDSIKALQEEMPELIINNQKLAEDSVLNLEYPNNHDLREQIFTFAVNSKWVIIEMTPKGVELENIFRSLTNEEKNDAKL